MTKEELKERISMSEVMAQYGIKVTNNMAKCPFHGKDKHPSMKVFKDGYKCFACNKGGDIFTFVMDMDNCDFKTAYIQLGGTYENLTGNAKIVAQMKIERARNEAERRKNAAHEIKRIMFWFMDLLHESTKLEPYSHEWCVIKNYEPHIVMLWQDYTAGREINELDVLRVYREVRHKLTSN